MVLALGALARVLEKQRAEHEKQRAEHEKRRAEQEKQRADAATRELELLRGAARGEDLCRLFAYIARMTGAPSRVRRGTSPIPLQTGTNDGAFRSAMSAR